MMQQYLDISAKYPDCILFFRLGDFYEMFFEDAKVVSRELDLVLTGKNCGLEERAPMCGVPFHACDTYIAKLVEKGYKIAICEQMEDPANCKGLVPRDVVQIITPGTVTSSAMLSEKDNNYLACVYVGDERISLCYADISTGELNLTSISKGESAMQHLLDQLIRIGAKEIVAQKSMEDELPLAEAEHYIHPYINYMEDAFFSEKACTEILCRTFNVHSPKGLGIGGFEENVMALGGLLEYLASTQQSLSNLTEVKLYDIAGHMALDKFTIRNLEITETLYDKKNKGTLLWVLDKCNTAMGSRKLKQWLREPLNSAAAINKRLAGVRAVYDDVLLRNNLRESLKQVYDLERLAGRIAGGNANGKDMIALRNSIAALPEIKSCLSSFDNELLGELCDNISLFEEIYGKIDAAIVEEPPLTIKEGGLIKPGYSEDLDNLKLSIKDAKKWIASLEAVEKERTGITHLKVGFNKVFGYYIEVSRSNLDLVPENYIRKQTLVGAERFITPELKETESLVLNAETKINKLEYELFVEIRSLCAKYIRDIQKTAASIAELDAVCSFSEVSAKLGYVQPEVDEGDEIFIKNGRHPVIEQTLESGLFVPNDIYINGSDTSMLLITGPNMSGKSTYMRQTALIVLMAQAGCFVPAEQAKIGVADRIFTRIGASDNIAMGESTFYVEMSELAYILNSSTPRSLVILDEIGRGTSTYDGLSIAWASVDYLCDDAHRARTLFATHYHELTALEGKVKGCRNMNVGVSEDGGEVVFLHKILEGPASRSYGIHVAKIAGVPKTVLMDAEAHLAFLEESKQSADMENFGDSKDAENQAEIPDGQQISFFFSGENPVIKKIKSLNLMDTKPSEAIAILEELQKMAEKE